MDYATYFLNSDVSVVKLDTIEISHPNFSQTYYVVRNNRAGVTVTLENSQEQAFEWYPFLLKDTTITQTLEYGIEVSFGDLGEIIGKEIQNIRLADNMVTPPTVIYRAYASNHLTAPMIGPIVLEMFNPATKKVGTTFVARPPNVNRSGTGEVYTFDRFPMLRGTL